MTQDVAERAWQSTLDDARKVVDEHLQGTQRDFAEVVRRAHALDSDVVPVGFVKEARRYAPIVGIQRARVRTGTDWCSDTLTRIEANPDATAPSQRRELREIYRYIVGFAGVAAALLLAWNLQRELPSGQLPAGEQPVAVSEAVPRVSALPPTDLAPVSVSDDRSAQRLDAQVSPQGDEPIIIIDEPSRPRRSSSSPKRKNRVGSLRARAEKHWRRGELDAARRVLQQLVAAAGYRPAAELAYSDLFTLARQRGADRELPKLWRTYLRRFPRGRFADDARAGLCRSAPHSARTVCWSRYLRDFPNGSYRDEAIRTRRGKLRR